MKLHGVRNGWAAVVFIYCWACILGNNHEVMDECEQIFSHCIL